MHSLKLTAVGDVGKVLSLEEPTRFVYAPNYWQWFAHQKNHGILPEEIKHCETQLDLIKYLGLDVFSRNIYCKQDEYWFGGLCEEYFEDVDAVESHSLENGDTLTTREYHCKSGKLSEELRYVFKESTVVQKKFLITNYSEQAALLEQFIASRRWKYNPSKYDAICQKTGDEGIVVAGEFFSPLKMLHFVMNPVQTVYFLLEEPEFAKRLLDIHEKAQLDLVKQCVSQGVRVIMSMDNLDTMFHPPSFVEEYSASFYEKASKICHDYGAKFFIHACGNQRDNLQLISSYGVDGLEGVAFPPLGDIELDEAMRLTSDKFIISGGISAMETRDLRSREAVFSYVEELFRRMVPFRNRFIFSSSCNTSIDTSWDTIRHFRDAWLNFRDKY
jgi:uroporphyrinogen-III decarboxylase